jgi:hypothetical protein
MTGILSGSSAIIALAFVAMIVNVLSTVPSGPPGTFPQPGECHRLTFLARDGIRTLATFDHFPFIKRISLNEASSLDRTLPLNIHPGVTAVQRLLAPALVAE